MKRILPSLLACATLALAAGCGSSSKTTSTAGGASGSSGTPTQTGSSGGPAVQVTYRDIAIHPANITVHAGQRIVWTNDDDVSHNVISQGGPQSFTSSDFGKGGTYSFTPTKTGKIRYFCSIHPAAMVGTITVVQ